MASASPTVVVATPLAPALPHQLHLRSPGFAAFLAFLVPGLGHLYQGRTFKGLLYFVCILGTFVFGLRLGDGKVVYFDWSSNEKRTWAYTCQFWTGLPALPALVQAKFRSADDYRSGVDAPLTTKFIGRFDGRSLAKGDVTGDLSLAPDANGNVTGTLIGSLVDEKGASKPVSLKVTFGEVSRRVSPDPKRPVALLVEEDRTPNQPGQPGQEARIPVTGRLVGSIPRSVFDWYGAPLVDRELLAGDADTDLEQAHFTLGTRFELGVVYTMIAGLLNILAIYDALEGPAYGDEERELEEGRKLLGGKS
jgi:hypothetical protein